MDNESGVRTTVVQVLDAIMHEDESGVPEPLAWFADTGVAGLHAAATVLGGAAAGMVRALAAPHGEPVAITVALTDIEDEPLSIDECPPPLRAATRMLLALVNEQPGDAEAQWRIVRDNAPDELSEVFLHLAVWSLHILDLAEEAGAVDTAVPGWLRHLCAGY